MAKVGVKEHERFCKLDGWELIQGAKHMRYKKVLPDKTVLMTTISRDRSTEYGPGLWNQIWKEQLKLADTDDFFTVLSTRTPADRAHLNEIDTSVDETDAIPYWLVEQLQHTVGLSEAEISELDIQGAKKRWDIYCGIEEPEIGELSQDDLQELLELYAEDDNLSLSDQDYLAQLQAQILPSNQLEEMEIEQEI